jgi:nucleoside-diphosphate-sugar epimerase
MRSCIDNQRARQRLEWNPKVQLSEGIERTVEWFRKSKR